MTPRDAIQDLAGLPRTGWLLKGVPQPETVGEHSFLVSLITLTLALFEAGENGLSTEQAWADVQNACCRALLHDVGEYFTGDLTPYSYRCQTRAPEVPQSSTPASALLASLQEHAETHAKAEALVKLADRFERFLQAREYADAGLTGLGDLIVFAQETDDLTFPQSSAAWSLVKHMVEYVAALSEASHFEPSVPHASMARYYGGSDCVAAMLSFQLRHGNPRSRLIDDVIRRGLVSHEATHVVDVGCGTADLGLYLLQRLRERRPAQGNRVLTRIDINRQILDSLRLAAVEGVTIRNYRADFERRWPLASNSQDVVVLGEVLEHSFAPEWLVLEAHRVLRPSGALIVTIPNEWHFTKVARFLVYQRLEGDFFSQHIRYFSRQTIRSLVESRGFEVKVLRGFSLRKGDRGRFGTSYLAGLLNRWSMWPRHYFLLACRAAGEPSRSSPRDLIEDAMKVAEFLKISYRAKRLRFGSRGNDSIGRAAFACGLLSVSLGLRAELCPERIATCAVVLGWLESGIGEYSPLVRAELLDREGDSVLEHMTQSLPSRTRDSLRDLCRDLRKSPEWALVRSWFRMERANGTVTGIMPEQWQDAVTALYR